MKKLLSIVLALTFVIASAISFSAVSAATDTPTLTVTNPATVTAGEEFTVTIEVSGNPGLWSTKVALYFDPELVCENITPGDVFAAGTGAAADNYNRPAATNANARAVFVGRGVDPADYNAAMIFFNNDDSNANNYNNGTLVSFTMRAPSEPGTYFLGVIDALGYTINCIDEDVVFAYVNSSVTVEPAVDVRPGDVNGDGLRNVRDLQQLKKLLSAQITRDDIVVVNTDLNEDGLIDFRDMALLKKIIAA